jgi:hypothetical protein
MLARLRRVELIVIRSDFLINFRLPVQASVEVMPNKASIVSPEQRWLPPLLQRGLIPRLDDRKGSVRSVALKAYPQNCPKSMLDPAWGVELSDRGFDWMLDLCDPITGHQTWHDFSDVDIVLCMRSDGFQPGWLRKPATKMINAWHAGSIPLVSREPGYLELSTHREDCMIVDSPRDVLNTLETLRNDSSLVRRLEEGCSERAREFSVPSVLGAWHNLLIDEPLPPRKAATLELGVKLGRVTARLAASRLRGETDSFVWNPGGNRP